MDQRAIVMRDHRAILEVYERRMMLWLVARLPLWVTPDHMTAFGVAGALVCGLSYAAAWLSRDFLWLASLGLIANWLGDSTDGNLARHRKIERPRYGFFIDHTTDVVSQVFIFLGLGASPYMRFDTACLALLSYWLAALYSFIRALSAGVFQISYWGIGPTEIRLALLAYTLSLLSLGPVAVMSAYGRISPIDAFCALVFVGVFGSFLALTWHESRRLAALEALPQATTAPGSPPPSATGPS